MEPRRYRIAGVVALLVGGTVTLLQYTITPLSNGNMTGAQTVAAVTQHHAAMGVALALDTPNLLVLPAVLFIGWLAAARTSAFASVATAMLFLGYLVAIPPIFGLDGLAFLASSEPDKAAMAHLIDSWQNSTWFGVGLFSYLALVLVGSILLGIALWRAKLVPSWVAVATGAWPVLGVLGQGASLRGVAIAGYTLQLITWAACAMCLARARRSAPVEPVLVDA